MNVYDKEVKIYSLDAGTPLQAASCTSAAASFASMSVLVSAGMSVPV